MIIIESHRQFIIEETEVGTDIVLGRSFPFQFVELHRVRGDSRTGIVIADRRIGSHIRSRTLRSITTLSPAGA